MFQSRSKPDVFPLYISHNLSCILDDFFFFNQQFIVRGRVGSPW